MMNAKGMEEASNAWARVNGGFDDEEALLTIL
jgi:hypothetical protein